MNKIIIVNGVGRSGKDTFIDSCIEYLDIQKVKTYKTSTIDSVKKCVNSLILATFDKYSDVVKAQKAKDDGYRKLLSDVKDLWTDYNNGPYNEIITKCSKVDGAIFFILVREPTEIDKLKEHFGESLTTVLLKRDVKVPNNHADQNVENYEYDYLIENYYDDVKDLKNVAINFLKELEIVK